MGGGAVRGVQLNEAVQVAVGDEAAVKIVAEAISRAFFNRTCKGVAAPCQELHVGCHRRDQLWPWLCVGRLESHVNSVSHCHSVRNSPSHWTSIPTFSIIFITSVIISIVIFGYSFPSVICSRARGHPRGRAVAPPDVVRLGPAGLLVARSCMKSALMKEE